jgi:archaellum component FlaG (FlaF/FlaG flagellin family)
VSSLIRHLPHLLLSLHVQILYRLENTFGLAGLINFDKSVAGTDSSTTIYFSIESDPATGTPSSQYAQTILDYVGNSGTSTSSFPFKTISITVNNQIVIAGSIRTTAKGPSATLKPGGSNSDFTIGVNGGAYLSCTFLTVLFPTLVMLLITI